MENKRIRNVCRFIAVCDGIVAGICALITAAVADIWILAEIFLLIPSGTYVVTGWIAGFLAVALCLAATMTIVYAIALLWVEREEVNGTYTVFQILGAIAGVLGIAAKITVCIAGVYFLWIYLGISFGVVIPAILNIVGFALKKMEKIENPETEKAGIKTQPEIEQKKVGIKTQPEIEQKKAGIRTQPEIEQKKAGIRGIRGEYAGEILQMRFGEVLVFGTHAQYCQVLFRDRHISRRHCSVRYEDDVGKYEIVDYSRNGTFWGDGKRLPSGVACRCSPGTIFTMDHRNQIFQLI